MNNLQSATFKGRRFSRKTLYEIKELVEGFPNLSRTELSNTVCELLSWKRPNGHLKALECCELLEYLESNGLFKLPPLQKGRPQGRRTEVNLTKKSDPQPVLSGVVRNYTPLILRKIEAKFQRNLWNEYIDRYHYLGYKIPYGAHLRYFIESGKSQKVLGCLQFSSPAWKMQARDRWINWTDEQRKSSLQKVVNNSRFLILPWVRIKYLASAALSLAACRIQDDWENLYGYRPVLLETLVDSQRFKGICYKASNWVHVGKTSGRGRMDRENARHGLCPKEIFVYPLTRGFREKLQAL